MNEFKKWSDNISGKMRVFKNERDGKVSYSTTLGVKKEDGSYDNAYITLGFGRDVDTTKIGDEIVIKRGFMTFYRGNEDRIYFKIVVMEIDGEDADFIAVNEDGSLPF